MRWFEGSNVLLQVAQAYNVRRINLQVSSHCSLPSEGSSVGSAAVMSCNGLAVAVEMS